MNVPEVPWQVIHITYHQPDSDKLLTQQPKEIGCSKSMDYVYATEILHTARI